MRRSADSPLRPPPPSIPEGWFPVHPTHSDVSAQSSPFDGLGLAKGVHAATLRLPRILSNNAPGDERIQSARSSPRHRRLQQAQQQQHEQTAYTAADAFAQNRSLRLARLTPRVDNKAVPAHIPLQHHGESDDGGSAKQRIIQPQAGILSARSRAARLRETHAPPIVPLHHVVRGFDDAVDASPRAESNQVAVTELFVANWMDCFERERGLYKSIALHAEIAFRELYRITANLTPPNDIVTAFACKIFDDMVEHFGPYAMIVRVLSSELRQAIYAPSTLEHPSLPYYAVVKTQKKILISLRKDQLRRQERNDFLRYEIDKVHETFLHFLDQCGYGLVRTIFHEWYSVAVVRKRNSKKYIEHFSAWFGSSAKALVPRLFLVWKRLAVETKVARMHERLTSNQINLATVQKQIEELSVHRNLAQLESLAIRNDRKQAEDTIQRLHRKIQSASAFLEDSPRRQALVAQEAQLRVEAVTFLPPLVLESLLRGFHSVGFLQPLHSEFAPASQGTEESKAKPQHSQQPHAPASDESVLSQSVAWLHGRTAHTSDDDSVAHEIPLNQCLNYVQGIRLRIEDDPTAYVLFLSKAELAKTRNQLGPHEQVGDDNAHADSADTTAPTQASPLGLQKLVRQFSLALQHVRHQDEHYACHAKLFSSRMLERSEISVVPRPLISAQSEPSPPPPASSPPLFSDLLPVPVPPQRVLFSSIDTARVAGSSRVDRRLERDPDKDTEDDGTSLDQLPLLQACDLDRSPRQTRAFLVLALGQLVLEYGSLLFSPTDLTAFVRNRMLQKVMLRGIAGGKHTLKTIHVPISTENTHNEGDREEDDSRSSDDDDSDDDNETLVNAVSDPPEAMAEHGKTKVPLFHKQATQRRMQIAPRRKSSYRGLHAPIANDIDRALSHLKAAYDVWNRIMTQLIHANIVAARGGIVTDDAASGGTDPGAVAPPIIPEKSPPTPFGTLRPRLQLHIEPLPSGPLMVAAKDKDRSDAPRTPSGGHRRSVATLASSTADWSYEASKVRRLSLGDTQQLVHAVRGLHAVVRNTAQQRAVDFTAAKQNLRSLRAAQWHHACELANPLCSATTESSVTLPTTAAAAAPDPSGSNSLITPEDDPRRDVFECITFANEAMERLFRVEDDPDDELLRVRTLLERKKHVVRLALYAKPRFNTSGGLPTPTLTHAATLDELWHIVKVLRLPRDVRVLPTLRDDELLVGTSYFHEHVFSPDDLAEVLLQLCNEQFLPHMTPLSARVDYFVTHHLPLAMQHQSAIRSITHTHDVKRALGDHAHTLRTIFRRYCANERDLLAAAVAKRRAAVVAATACTSTTAVYAAATTSSPSTSTSPQLPAAVPPQGITKFMRLADWHAFIADYKLLRAPRFTFEYATVVFCNVQEAESGLEDNLEMIFSEFTEAVVALSVVFYPNPFLRHATRVHQFIRRYLPVSPDEHI